MLLTYVQSSPTGRACLPQSWPGGAGASRRQGGRVTHRVWQVFALGFQKVSTPFHWCRVVLCNCSRISDLLSTPSFFPSGPLVAQLFLHDSRTCGRNYICHGFDVFLHILVTGDLNCSFVTWQCHKNRKSKHQEGEEGKIVPTKQNP